MERIDYLKELKLLLGNTESYDQGKLTDLEQYFTGVRTGCRCKRNVVISALNNMWFQSLENELINLENGTNK